MGTNKTKCQKLKKMRSRGIEVIKPVVRRQKPLTKLIFICRRKAMGPVITENDLKFTKIKL